MVSIYPNVLNIFLTKRCNLKCIYCYVNKERERNKELTIDTFKKAFDLFLRLPSKNKVLHFTGGEPLLKFKKIKEIVKYTKRFKDTNNFNYSIVTNGTLLNKSQLRFFKSNEIAYKISLDGTKETHDSQRPFKFKNADSSYKQIIENIKTIHEKNDIGVSMVFSPCAVEDLSSNIKSLWKKGFHEIDFFPQAYARWSKNDLIKMKGSLKEIEDFIILIYKEAKFEKDIFKNSLTHSFMHKNKVEKDSLCDQIHLGWDGNFYCCDKALSLSKQERKKYVIQRKKGQIDNNGRLDLLKQIEIEIEKLTGIDCKKCRYVKYCFCRIGSFIYFSSRPDDFRNYFLQHCYISKVYIKTFSKIIKELNKNILFKKTYGII